MAQLSENCDNCKERFKCLTEQYTKCQARDLLRGLLGNDLVKTLAHLDGKYEVGKMYGYELRELTALPDTKQSKNRYFSWK